MLPSTLRALLQRISTKSFIVKPVTSGETATTLAVSDPDVDVRIIPDDVVFEAACFSMIT